MAILATVALWGVPQWRARSAGTELVAAARAASLGELGTRTFESAPAVGTAAADGPSVTSSGGSARVETLARWSEGADWGVVLTHAWDRRQACVATSMEPTPRCGPVDEIASGGSGASAPSGVTGSLMPLSRAAAESQWPTLLAGRSIPVVSTNGGLVVADARALVATPWASMPVAGGSSGTDTTAAAGEQTVWVTWRQGNTVIQSGRASDTTSSILVAAVTDAETPVELWLVSSSGRVRADGGTGGSGGGGSGTAEPFSISTLTPVAGAPVLLDGRAVRVGTDSSRAWNWVFGTNLVPSSSSVQNIVRFPTAGTFVITLSTRLQSGQVVTQSRTVTVSSGGGQGGSVAGVRPRAVLTASGTFVAPNQAVSMSLAQSTTPATGGISTYRFVSGAGSAQSGVATNFTTVYRSAGTFTALGIITDAAGVVDTARLTITVATGGAPLDGGRSSLNVLPLTDRLVGGEARVMPMVARLVDVNGLGRGSVVPTVTVAPLNGTAAVASASAFSATSSSTGEATGTLTVPSLAPGVTGTWELALRTGGASGPVLRRDTVTFTGVADAVAAPVPLVGRLSITSDVPQGSPVIAGQPIAPALVGQLRSLDGTTNLAVDGVPVSVVFQQGNGTLSGASGVTDGAGRVVLAGLSLNTVAGSYQLALSAEGYVPATTRVFDVLTAVEGSRLSVLQQPALTMIRGQTNVVQPSVRLLNADGSPAQIPGVSVAALVASSTARGGTTLVGATATTNGAGVATFSSLRLNGLPGLVTLRFAANGYQPAVARSIQLNAPAPFVSLDTAWSSSLRHGQVSAATPVITLRDIQDRIVGTAGSSGGSGTGITVSLNAQTSTGDLSFSTSSVATTAGVARFPDFRAFANNPLSRTVSIRAAGFDSTTATMGVVHPSEGGAGSGAGTGLKWQLVSGAPTGSVRSGTPIGPIVLQLVDASNAPVAAAGYPVWFAATAGRTLAGQDNQGRAGGATTDGTGRVTISSVTLQGAAGATGLITRGRESYEQGVSRNLGTATIPVTMLEGAPTTATRSGATTLSATDGTALAPITVQLRDGSGNSVAESGATVTLTATGGVTFSTGSATATTDANGVATITAAIPQGLTGTVSLSATISRDPAQVLSAGGAATLTPALGSLSLVGTPVATVESRAPTSFVPSGGTFATTLQVQLRDGGNRAVPISGVSIQLAIDSTGPSADEQASTITSGATAVTNASGVATFSSLVLTGSGSVRLTATAPALASVTANAPTTLTTRIRIAPAPVSALAITAAPTSGQVNADLSDLSVELRDASDARVPEAGRVVTISLDPTSGWTGTLSGSTSRTTDATGRVTFPGLRLIGAAPVSGTGAPRLIASLTGASSATTSAIALTPGRSVALTITSAPDTLFIDVPAAVVGQLRDVAGNATGDAPTNAPGNYLFRFAGGGISHAPGMDETAFSTGGSGTGQATFTLIPRAAGLPTTGPAAVRSITMDTRFGSCGNGCERYSASFSRVVRPGPARQITVTQQPTTQQMGAPIASVLRLGLLDASGNAPTGGPSGVGTTLAGVPLSVAVATNLTPGRTLESVASQSSDLTSLTDATGTATFAANTLRLMGSTGAIQLIGSGSAPLSGIAGSSLTGTAGAAAALQWVVAPPARGRIGVGLTAMSVRQIDTFGNPVSSPTRLITLEPVEAGYTVGGNTATTTGSGTAGFGGVVISGPRGLLTLRATSPGLTSALAPAALDLSSGSAASIALVRSLPTMMSVDAALSGSQSLQVQLVDAGGFPVYESGRTLTLNLPGTSSIPAGRVATTNATGLADFGATRVRGAAPSTLVGGSVTDANGLPALSLASLSLAVGTPTQFTLLTPLPTTVAPGMALSPTVRAQLRDVSGNATPVAGRELRFFAQDGASGGDGYPQNALAAANTDASGIATFAPLIPNAWLPAVGQTIGAQVRAVDGNGGSTGWPGFNQTTGLTLTVSAGAATQIGIVSAPATVTVESPFGASATDSVIAQIRDADGNAVALSGRTATLALSDGATGALSGAALTATSNASGRLVFALSGRSYIGLSGARSWTVTANAGTPTLTTGTRAVTVNPGAATALVVTTAPSDTAALGLALARQPVVEFRDAGGNRATGATGVTVTLFDGEASAGLSLAGTTASSSAGVATFTSLALTGPLATYRLTASATVSSTPLAVELPAIVLGVGPATQITFLSGFRLPDQLAIGVSSLGEPRIQLRDAGGNAAPQSGVSISAALIEGPGGTLGGTTTRTTTGTGTAAFPGLTLTGLPGSHVIEFSTSTFSVRDTVVIPVGLMDASQSTLSATPTTISASDASSPAVTTITLTAKDNTGTNRPNQLVRIALSGTAASGATAVGGLSGTTNSSGVATFSVRSTRAGTLTITGFNDATAQQMTQTTSVTVTNGAAVADSTLLSLSRSSIAPTGVDTSLATITVRDRFLNPVAGASVVLTATPSTGLTLQTGGVTNAQGQTFLAITGTQDISTTIGVTVNSQTATGRTASLSLITAGPGGVSGELQTWLRADTGVVTNAGTVTAWSGRLRSAASAPGVSMPTWSATGLNGRPAVLLSGTQGLRIPSVTLGNQTVVMVLRQTGGVGVLFEHGINTNTNDGTFFFGTTGATVAVRRGGATLWSAKNHTDNWGLDNVPRIAVVRYAGTQTSLGLRLNGTPISLTDAVCCSGNAGSAPVTADLFLGHRSSNGPFPMTGAISEVIAYNRTLSDAEVLAIESELAVRWGLNLPTASFTATPGSGLAMNFNAAASTAPMGVSSYAWDFGDLTTGSGVTTSRTYAVSGNYLSVLTVTDVLGRTASAERLLSVGSSAVRTSNLLVWARTDLGATVVNNRITRLKDLSGNGRDLTVATTGTNGATNQGPLTFTLNGRQAARFLAADKAVLSTPAMSLGATASVFIASRPLGTGNNTLLSHGAYGTGDGGNGLRIGQGTSFSAGFTRAGGTTAYERNIAWTPVVGQTQLRSFQMGGTQASMLGWLNGASVSATNPYAGEGSNVTPLSQPITISSVFGSNAWSYNDGEMMEVLVYDAVLSAGERLLVEQMLAQRWGVGGNPVPSFTAVLDTGRVVNVNASASTAGSTGLEIIASYAWDFGDLTSGTGVTASRRYTANGSYTIQLTVTNTIGRQASTSQSVSVTTLGPAGVGLGMVSWLRADTLVSTSGSTVTAWNGQGLGATTASGAGAPTYSATGLNGRPALVFNGTQGLRIPNVTLGAHTVFITFRNTANFGMIWEHSRDINLSNNGSFLYGHNTSTTAMGRSGTSGGKSFTSQWSTDNVPRVAMVRYTGTVATDDMRLNGMNITLTSGGSATYPTTALTQDFFLGHRNNGPALFINGAIGDVVVYNRVLTDAEVSAVEQVLGTRIGLAAGAPVASFAVTSMQERAVVFSAAASSGGALGGTISSYAWDFGDLTNGTGLTPTRTYTADGTYTVSLTVTNTAGLTNTTTRSVSVAGAPTIAGLSASPRLWMRPESGMAVDGTTVRSWSSSAGPNLTLQAGASGCGAATAAPTLGVNSPSAGRRTVRFMPGQCMVASRTPDTLRTVYVMYRYNASTPTSAGGANVDWGSGLTDLNRTEGSGSISLWSRAATGGLCTTGALIIRSPAPSNAWTSLGWEVSGQTLTGRLNGSTFASNQGTCVTATMTAPLAASDVLRLTAELGAANGFEVGEVIGFSTVLSAGDRAVMDNHMASRWGLPTASFTVAPLGRAVTVNGSASTAPGGATIASYAWTFGDGGTATGVSPTYTYASDGTRTITLTVTSSTGVTATATQGVTVTNLPVLARYRADTAAVDGSNNITSWTDLSGNNRNLTPQNAVAGTQPQRVANVLGGGTRPTVRLRGTALLAVTGVNGWTALPNTNWTVAMYIKEQASLQNIDLRTMRYGGGLGFGWQSLSQGGIVADGFAWNQTTAANPVAGSSSVKLLSLSGGVAELFFNNSLVVGPWVIPGPGPTDGSFLIGGGWHGDVGEVVIYGRTLSTAERATLVSQMSARWAP